MTGTRDPRPGWGVVAFVGLAQLVAALDATIVNVALPSAQAALHLSDASRQWVITAYTLTFAGFVLAGGRVADYVGRRRVYLAALLGFAVASAVGGAATSGSMLIGARAVQGAFAAVLTPTALSLLAVTYTDARDRAKAFAIYGAIAGSGGAIGLVLGGALTEYLSWRWCLFVNLPIVAVAAAGGWRTLPDLPGRRRPLDPGGVVLSVLGLAAVVEGCSQAVSHGWSSPRVLGLLIGAAALLLSLAAWEARVASPVLPLGIIRDRRRIGAYVAVAFAMGAMLATFFTLTYFLQVVRHYSPLVTGLAFLPLSAAVQAGAGGVATRFMHRVAARRLVTPGLLLAALGLLLLTRMSTGSPYAGVVLPAEVLLGLGMGLVFVPSITAAQAGVPASDAGIAAAVLSATQQAGGSIGTAVLNTVATSASIAYAAAHRAGLAALVHGYATTARWTAPALLLAAAVCWLLLQPTGAHDAAPPVPSADWQPLEREAV